MPHNDINKKRNKMETRMREILKDVKSERLTENEAVMELCILFTVSNNEVAVCRYCKQPVSVNGKCTNVACGNWLSKG